MERIEKAENLFCSGCNCAQAVLTAYKDEIGLSEQQAMKLASSFGGGMGRMREVCGACSAAFMIAGLLRGYAETGDDKAKAEHYRLIQAMADRFRAKHGTILCRELLRTLNADTSPIPSARTAEYYKMRPCLRFVRSAAEIVEEFLMNEKQGNEPAVKQSGENEG